MLLTASKCLSEHAPGRHFWQVKKPKMLGATIIGQLLPSYRYLQLRACALLPVYVAPSVLGAAFLIDREHALSDQNWFINACAEQPKTV